MTVDVEDLRQVVMGPELWDGFVAILHSRGLEAVLVTAAPWSLPEDAPSTYRIAPDPLKVRPMCEWSPLEIKALRMALGMSQERFALRLRLSSRRVVHRWEDQANPTGPSEPMRLALDGLFYALDTDQMGSFGVILMQLATE